MAHKYLQYHFDGDGKLKLTNNEDKEEKREKRKEGEKRKEIEDSPSIWAKVQLS